MKTGSGYRRGLHVCKHVLAAAKCAAIFQLSPKGRWRINPSKGSCQILGNSLPLSWLCASFANFDFNGETEIQDTEIEFWLVSSTRQWGKGPLIDSHYLSAVASWQPFWVLLYFLFIPFFFGVTTEANLSAAKLCKLPRNWYTFFFFGYSNF